MIVMKKNIGYFDRLIRLVVALVLSDLCMTGKIVGVWNVLTWIGVSLLTLTAIFAICPLYGICGIRTNQQKKRSPSGN